MSKLINLQNKFQAYLLHADDAITSDIVSTGKVPVDVRLSIYGNAYQSRLVDALASTYPVLHSYVGDEQFEEIALAYIREHPSCFRSIRWFGDKLELFLTTCVEYNEFPYLAELAKLEWTMASTFDAADSNVIDMTEAATIPPEQWATMRLLPHPSLQLIRFHWNVVQIWQEIMNELTPTEPQESETAIQWIFWRHDYLNQFCSLSSEEAYAMNAMLEGFTFGDICEGLCEWFASDEAPMHAASFLKNWIDAGMIAAIAT